MTLQLLVRSFSFSLLQPLRTATGVVAKRRGWLLRLCDGDTGAVGWGEVAPLRTEQWLHCKILMGALPEEVSRNQLEVLIHQGPGAFGFGLGSALAELDGLVGDLSSQPWQEAPPSAHLSRQFLQQGLAAQPLLRSQRRHFPPTHGTGIAIA